MNRLLTFLTFLLFAFIVSKAVLVKVDVKEVCLVEIKSLNISLDTLPKLDAEIYNSGSLPYNFRVSVEGKNKVWSQKIFEAPGDLKKVSLHFLPSNETKLKVYFCNKIFEKNIETREKSFEEGDWFSIRKARIYSDFIVLEVISNVSTDAAIIPLKYPDNWIVENYIGKLKVGRNFVRINFESDVKDERSVSFAIASTDGKYFSKSEVKVERKIGLEYWLFYIFDTLRTSIGFIV